MIRRIAALAGILAAGGLLAMPPQPAWYRGSVHSHANWGAPQLPTTSPDVVVRWYLEHGYNFVALTDLNHFTPVDGLKALFDSPGRFLVMPGIELSQEGLQPGDKIVDTVGLGVSGPVEAASRETVSEALDGQAKAIRSMRGLPIAAHPNLTWALTAADIASTDRTDGPRFFELWNTEPGMNNSGGGGRPSTEQLWDAVLSSGRLLYGVAVDDSHHFYEYGTARESARQLSNPGRAWIMVRAAELSTKALLDAMKSGDFYATTGITLESYQVTAAGVRIALSDAARDLGWSKPGTNPHLYRTEFIGRGGRVLKTDESLEPEYRFSGNDLYVRARITSSDGLLAWTQPTFPQPQTRTTR